MKPERFIASVAILCLVSVGLLAGRIVASDSTRYIFLLTNLVLAVIPVFLAWGLVLRVRAHGWLKWQQIILTALWLVFLPNSFYLMTDFVHLRPNYEASLIYDVIMLGSFMWSGLVLGLTSVYLVHRELLKRFNEKTAIAIVAAIFFLISFAIYLGRFNRWNTWDLLLQPAGLLFDVSDRLINPEFHSDTHITTLGLFFICLSLYLVVYEAVRLLKPPKN